MLKKYLVTGTLAAMCAGVALGAQAPSSGGQQTPQQPTTQTTPRSQSQAATTTVTGCVYRESDVPGREPNIAERAGILEDYILADVKMSGSQSPSASSSTTQGAIGTSGTSASMFKLERIDDEKLRAHVGKRVEVTGRIDADAADRPAGTSGSTPAQPDRSASADGDELPAFEVSSIREVPGTCPPTPQTGR